MSWLEIIFFEVNKISCSFQNEEKGCRESGDGGRGRGGGGGLVWDSARFHEFLFWLLVCRVLDSWQSGLVTII